MKKTDNIGLYCLYPLTLDNIGLDTQFSTLVLTDI